MVSPYLALLVISCLVGPLSGLFRRVSKRVIRLTGWPEPNSNIAVAKTQRIFEGAGGEEDRSPACLPSPSGDLGLPSGAVEPRLFGAAAFFAPRFLASPLPFLEADETASRRSRLEHVWHVLLRPLPLQRMHHEGFLLLVRCAGWLRSRHSMPLT